jgi:hypothetical protein
MRVRVSLHIPVYQLVRPCWMVGGSWALLLAPRRLAWGVRTPSTMCNSCSGQEMIKGMESTGRIHTPILLLSCAHLFIFFLRFQASKFSPPITTMTSHLPRSCLHTKADHVVLRWVLGWQSPEYDDWVQCGAFLLINLQPGGGGSLSSSAATLPPMSSFLLSLLEFYGLLLHHLSPTFSYWWQHLSTYVRCSSACRHRSPCSACSTCHDGLGRGRTQSTPITSYSGPRVRLRTSQPSPSAVGSLEGGLGDRACRCSRPPCAANRGQNGQTWQLGGGSKAVGALCARGRTDQAPG